MLASDEFQIKLFFKVGNSGGTWVAEKVKEATLTYQSGLQMLSQQATTTT